MENSETQNKEMEYCQVPITPPKEFDSNVSNERAELINTISYKWLNGTVLHYYFFENAPFAADESQKEVVRQAFNKWKEIGIGLEFQEVNNAGDAEIRIGFEQGKGSWSYIGNYILELGQNERTMNFGWSLTRGQNEIDTAIHEIGHTLGFPHEHQNPNAGIIWDEEAVYEDLAKPPNRWPREKTFHNIIRKITPDTVEGSNWDPNSIMHYPFGPGLVREPEEFKNGIYPAPGLSERDIEIARYFYPILEAGPPELRAYESESLAILPGEQRNFRVIPTETRDYEFRTFGKSDTVMVLFEEDGDELRYVDGDDDSGKDRNAQFRIRLIKGKKYVLRIRLYYQYSTGKTVVMYW